MEHGTIPQSTPNPSPHQRPILPSTLGGNLYLSGSPQLTSRHSSTFHPHDTKHSHSLPSSPSNFQTFNHYLKFQIYLLITTCSTLKSCINLHLHPCHLLLTAVIYNTFLASSHLLFTPLLPDATTMGYPSPYPTAQFLPAPNSFFNHHQPISRTSSISAHTPTQLLLLLSFALSHLHTPSLFRTGTHPPSTSYLHQDHLIYASDTFFMMCPQPLHA